MKKLIFAAALVVLIGTGWPVRAQEPDPVPDKRTAAEKERDEQILLDKYLKIISDPNADFQAKSDASDGASALIPRRDNEATKALFLQNIAPLASQAVNGLLLDEPVNAPFRASNFKFIQENITDVPPEVQIAVISFLTLSVGIQTREYEAIYHQIAKSAVEQHLKGDELLSEIKSEAVSQGCLLLSLSRFYDATDEALMIKAVAVSKSPTYLSLALSHRNLLTKSLLAQLKENNKELPKENIAMKVVVAQIDENARKNLIGHITVSIHRKYDNPSELDMERYMNASHIELLRFLDFPQKKGLVAAASKSNDLIIKKSALLIAAEDYPDLILNDASLKNFFKSSKITSYESYATLLTYLSLRHPSYVKKVQDDLGIKLYNEQVKKLRYTGISSYNFSSGFDGL